MTHHPSLSILPFRALLKTKEWKKRKNIVLSLYESRNPSALPILRDALLDPDEPIRLLSAHAIEQIAQRTEKSLHTLREKVAHKPTDTALCKEFVNLLCEFASQSTESTETRKHLYREALQHIEGAHLMNGARTWSLLKRGEILFKLGRYDESKDVLSSIPPTANEYTWARFLIAEIAMAQGKPDQAKNEMKTLNNRPLPKELLESVKYWNE